MEGTTILHSVLDVFSEVGAWIPEAVTQMMPMFYAPDTGLTLLGILAVAGLGFSIIFLIMGIIQRFLHFGG